MEDLAAFTADRLRAQGGEFVAPVGLVESPVSNPEPAQSVHAPIEMAFGRDTTDDQMRMGKIRRKKRFGNLNGCVAGLDDLLRKRKICPQEEVDVGEVVLGEFHG